MRDFLSLVVALAAAVTFACGGSVETDDPSSNASTSRASASAGGMGTGGTGTVAMGVGGAGAATGGTGPGGTGGSSPGGYRAFGYSGGLEHLAIVKHDPVRDVCVRITLSAPASGSALPITVPAQWSIDGGEMGHATIGCTALTMSMTFFQATGGSGSISWIPPMMCPFCIPTTVDIHATLTFAPGPSWLPASEPLDADGITVEAWQ